MVTKAKIGSAIASAALLGAAVFTPAFASSDFSIDGNGYRSDNTIRANLSNRTSVNQTNNSNISNDVDVHNNTGNNRASGNTGGDVEINTGDANANVDITNRAGMNILDLGSCGCDSHSTSIDILGNGSRSDNRVSLNSNNSTRVNQVNNTRINNDVDINNNTGHNSANNNTGGGWWFGGNRGDVSIDTGNANADVNISNEAGKNVANLGGSCNCGSNGDVSAIIAGNGSKSDNRINLDLNKSTRVNQNNYSNFDNDVDVNNNTGYNNARNNTLSRFLPVFHKDNYGKNHKSFYPNKYDMSKYFDRDGHGKFDKYLSKDYSRNNHKNLYSSFPKYDRNKYDRHSLLSNYFPYMKYMKDGYNKNNRYSGLYGNNWWDNNDWFGGNGGGDTSIQTGDANAYVNLDNAAGSNWLSM